MLTGPSQKFARTVEKGSWNSWCGDTGMKITHHLFRTGAFFLLGIALSLAYILAVSEVETRHSFRFLKFILGNPVAANCKRENRDISGNWVAGGLPIPQQIIALPSFGPCSPHIGVPYS